MARMRDEKGRFISYRAEARVKLRLERLRKAVERAAAGSLPPVGYLISQLAKSKVKRSRTAAPPGQPPHTRRGQLRRAIRYQMAADKRSIVIGPAASKLGTAGAAHEHGGRYKGARFPERPLMGPALEEAASMIGPTFAKQFRTEFR